MLGVIVTTPVHALNITGEADKLAAQSSDHALVPENVTGIPDPLATPASERSHAIAYELSSTERTISNGHTVCGGIFVLESIIGALRSR